MLARFSLKAKLTGFVVVIVAVALWTFGRFTLGGLLEMLSKAAGLGALTAARTLEGGIDPDWFETAILPPDPDATYKRLEQKLGGMTGEYIKRVGITRYTPDGVQHFINLPLDSSPDYYPPGTIDKNPDELYTKRDEGYHVWEIKTPGIYMAGWAPIIKNGNAIGVVYVLADAKEIQTAINTVSVAIVALMAAFILVAGILTYLLSASFEKTAVTDGLMGIYNHKYFKQRLEQEVAKSRRYGQLTSLVLLDIDFFKRVNDTYGHATGDITLKALAKWVQESVRSTDIVARYGGEEIVIILPFTGIAGAQEFAERLRLKISNQVVKDPGEKAEFRITVSIGVAQWEKGVDMIDLIKRADAALYHSKNNGRNQVTLYQEDLLPAPQPQASATVRH